MDRKTILVFFITAAFFGLLGAFSTALSQPGKMNNIFSCAAGNSFQDGWDAAKNRILQYGQLPLNSRANVEIKNISGTIENILDNSLSIKIKLFDPFSNPDLDTRNIEISAGTKIYQIVSKDKAQMDKELIEYNDNIKKKNFVALPSPITEKEVTLKDLQIGQSIDIYADKNIRDEKNIAATEIIIAQK